MTDTAAVPARRATPRQVLVAVAFAVFVAADDLTVVSTMLRPIIDDLGLLLPDGLDDAAWIVNVYLIAFVAVMPIAGRLSDVIGRRNALLGAYVLFLIGTTWIPQTDTLGPFLVARVFTALGGGAMVPIALAVVGDVYPEKSRSRALGLLAAIETMGWVAGPLYGAVLVRFLSWEWQFWLNIPLSFVGIAAMWWALADHDQGPRATSVDWLGAAALTTSLVALNLALLGNAEIQSVTGFDQLTGNGGGFDFKLLYPVALVAGVFFVWHQRRTDNPLVDRSLFAGRGLQVALAVNFVVGAALIISMVDVPIFINAVEGDPERSAVVAGWILSAMTAAMAITSYIGGRVAERRGYRLPILGGMAAALLAYLVMGLTWDASSSYLSLALQLAILGAGLGMVTAPTTSAVVDAAAPEKRGTAAAAVMVVRLMGLSVGLSVLTAWGLARFNSLRQTIELPPLDDPSFGAEVRRASADLTAQAIAETFLAAAAITAVGFAVAFLMRNRAAEINTADMDADPSAHDQAAEPGVHSVFAADTQAERDTGHLPAMATTGPPSGEQMTWLQKNVPVLLGVLTALILGAFVLIALLWGRLGDTQAELDATEAELATTQDDLARVESGAALFASQLTGFQEQIVALEPTLTDGLDDAIAGLEEFATSTISFEVNIDEEVVIDTEVVIDRNLQVPIDETVPINETFDTTIQIDTPLGFEVPLDISVPVDIEIPVILDLEIDVNETIPVSATVPVKLDIPIAIDIADTELAVLAQSLIEGLNSLDGVLGGLAGG